MTQQQKAAAVRWDAAAALDREFGRASEHLDKIREAGRRPITDEQAAMLARLWRYAPAPDDDTETDQ
jgi:hypothetical protein